MNARVKRRQFMPVHLMLKNYCKTLINSPGFYLFQSLNSTVLYLGQASTWNNLIFLLVH